MRQRILNAGQKLKTEDEENLESISLLETESPVNGRHLQGGTDLGVRNQSVI